MHDLAECFDILNKLWDEETKNRFKQYPEIVAPHMYAMAQEAIVACCLATKGTAELVADFKQFVDAGFRMATIRRLGFTFDDAVTDPDNRIAVPAHASMLLLELYHRYLNDTFRIVMTSAP